MYRRYRQAGEGKPPGMANPKRIIFYRGSIFPSACVSKAPYSLTSSCTLDGVSEGQFKQVLDLELPLLKSQHISQVAV